MITLNDLKKYDLQKMYETYDQWPQIAKESYNERVSKIRLDGIDHIVFAGMGGSGSIGDVFSSILSKTNIHVSIVKGYLLPKTVDKKTLVVVTSVSGNTDEPISILRHTKKIQTNVIAFSSGGKMEEFCRKNRIEHRNIQQIHSPRASFSSFLYSMLTVLQPLLPIRNSDIIESIRNMQKLGKNIASDNLNSDNKALELAQWITGIPIIYYPWGLNAAAIRFRNSLQENAKIHAIIEDVIESSHNGIVAWEKPSNVQPILLRGKDDYYKTQERWKILKEYFDEKDIDYRELISTSGSILTKVVTFIYMLDYASIYLAVKLKTDPSPVRAIDFVKSRL
jgi:glucose/mannose-6-phosphate isomerase